MYAEKTQEEKVNPELRGNILKLIYKELDAIGGTNIFRDTDWREPVYKQNYIIKMSPDEVQHEKFDYLRFSLNFEDGEPKILIFTLLNSSSRYEFHSTVWCWSWRLRKKMYTEFREYTLSTHVTCGHITFMLTESEHDELVVKTQQAWDKYLSLRDAKKDQDVVDKINLRLSK